MAINLTQNRFYCFGCKRRGNVLDFVSKFEDCSLREAVQRLDEWFFISEQTAEGREVVDDFQNKENTPPLTPQHLIASIEHQLAQLKKLILD